MLPDSNTLPGADPDRVYRFAETGQISRAIYIFFVSLIFYFVLFLLKLWVYPVYPRPATQIFRCEGAILDFNAYFILNVIIAIDNENEIFADWVRIAVDRPTYLISIRPSFYLQWDLALRKGRKFWPGHPFIWSFWPGQNSVQLAQNCAIEIFVCNTQGCTCDPLSQWRS